MSLPNAGQYGPITIVGSTGVPAIATNVTVYEGTSTSNPEATLYTDHTMATEASNPVATDEYGNLTIFAAPGQYTLSFEVGGVSTTETITVQPWPADVTDPGGTSPSSAVAGMASASVATGNSHTFSMSAVETNGWYSVEAQVTLNLSATVDSNTIVLSLLKNNLPICGAANAEIQVVNGLTGSSIVLSISRDLYLLAGDTLSLQLLNESGQTVTVCYLEAETTVASGSNGAVLPITTLDVASTEGWPSASQALMVNTSDGVQVLTFTGNTSTSFTGVSGGKPGATLSTGATVGSCYQSWFTCVYLHG